MPQPLPKICVLIMFLSLLLLTGGASAHGTAISGSITMEPDPPRAGAQLSLYLELVDTASAPVEDALVAAEFSLAGKVVEAVRFVEVEPAGNYAAELRLPDSGTYLVTLRDETFRQEESVTQVELPLGSSEPLGPIEFVFSPTPEGGSLTTWLIWLIGVPLVAGVLVTMLVLKSRPAEPTAPKEKE